VRKQMAMSADKSLDCSRQEAGQFVSAMGCEQRSFRTCASSNKATAIYHKDGDCNL
jgi:hypothetical protein